MNRRKALKQIGFCFAAGAACAVFPELRVEGADNTLEGTVLDNVPPLPQSLATDLDDINDAASYKIEFGAVGTETPTPDEVKFGRAILDAAPYNVSPIDVADYFARISLGQLGSDKQWYARAWPKRANPVIVGFFKATDYGTTSGDGTAWCAAFTNWCYARAILVDKPNPGLPKYPENKSATHSASSGDFRDWGTPVDLAKAKRGDIAVFEDLDDGQADPNHGHVGFFINYDVATDKIVVLGGNQIVYQNGQKIHVINSHPIPREQKSMRLNSIRTDPSLHRKA